ncbi:MAG: hypothetical protein OXC69_03270 [Candidatus Tectomicrobia bacterium]|nr:hypothetical protein [Candidatus Tectomicrobia bacterium]
MPNYVTMAQERLQGVVAAHESTTESVAYNNPNLWDANGILDGGITWDIPDQPFEFPYHALDDPTQESLFNSVYGERPAPIYPDVGETTNISAYTGLEITEAEACAQDVVFRILTYRGDREGRLDFSTRIFDAFGHTLSAALLEEMRRVSSIALTAAAARYRVISLVAYAEGQAAFIAAEIQPLFGQEEPVVVTIPVIDLS